MVIFADYARYYNLLYRDKDYAAEASFALGVLNLHGCNPNSLLDLGCGTGRHALEMTRRGIGVTGVDMSESMLAMGREMLAHTAPPDGDHPELFLGDVRTVRLGRKYDAVVSLFHVMSYQISESDILAAFETARAHLVPGGLFLFDFWYGPGVLREPPSSRTKYLEDTEIGVLRIASPTHHIKDNIVKIDYAITVTDKKVSSSRTFTEMHILRYWFLPELRRMASVVGFSVVSEGEWLNTAFAQDSPWYAWMMLKRQEK